MGQRLSHNAAMLRHQVRYCTAPDGVRIAYAVAGSGPPLVKAATHLDNVALDPTLPGFRHWMELFASRNTLIWYDLRGIGLSDRNPPSTGLDDWVGDLDAVVNDLGLDRFGLLGISMSGAIAIAYAARHPERVSHLILHASHTRAPNRHITDRGRAKMEAYFQLIEQFWDAPEPKARSFFADSIEFAPPEMKDAHDECRRATTTVEMHLRILRLMADVDVTELLPQVCAPTLVLHPRGDQQAPVKSSQIAAASIPNARLVLLDARNHMVQEDEPGWPQLVEEVRDFLGVDAPPGAQPDADGAGVLTAREREVIALVVAGKTNAEIAKALSVSVSTAQTHVHNMLEKVGVKRRSELAAYALRQGLVR